MKIAWIFPQLLLVCLSLNGSAQTRSSPPQGSPRIDGKTTIGKAVKSEVTEDHASTVHAGLSAAGERAIANAEARAEALGNAPLTETEKAQEEYNLSLIDYQKWTLHDLRATYQWQNISSIAIFIIVMLLVIAGVYFSWMQFRAAGFTSGESTVGASPTDGVKITSSTIGLVILVLSMCFFYLYLRYVYPVNITNAEQAVTNANQAVR